MNPLNNTSAQAPGAAGKARKKKRAVPPWSLAEKIALVKQRRSAPEMPWAQIARAHNRQFWANGADVRPTYSVGSMYRQLVPRGSASLDDVIARLEAELQTENNEKTKMVLSSVLPKSKRRGWMYGQEDQGSGNGAA